MSGKGAGRSNSVPVAEGLSHSSGHLERDLPCYWWWHRWFSEYCGLLKGKVEISAGEHCRKRQSTKLNTGFLSSSC